MVVIYDQNKTYIKQDAIDAKTILVSIYGEKLGLEAYTAVKNGRNGTSYRKNGGPLIRVVSEQEGIEIQRKEAAIGMLA